VVLVDLLVVEILEMLEILDLVDQEVLVETAAAAGASPKVWNSILRIFLLISPDMVPSLAYIQREQEVQLEALAARPGKMVLASSANGPLAPPRMPYTLRFRHRRRLQPGLEDQVEVVQVPVAKAERVAARRLTRVRRILSSSSAQAVAVVVHRHLEMQDLLEAEEILARQILVGLDQQQHQAQVQMW
jgi:hypothetical protein